MSQTLSLGGVRSRDRRVATIWRWLSEDAIKPWRHRSWIFPRDPDFEAKAGRVLDLYARVWEGKPLRKDEFVISSDEKTSIQARIRCHKTLAPAKSRDMRVEHEYARGGAFAYSPPGTYTKRRCSAAVRRVLASLPLLGSSNRS